MAEIKTVKINVDTQSAVSAMDNLSKATHDVSQSFEEVYGDLQPLTTRMGEAEDRLYELANAGKTTTKEYKDLLKTVGDYRKVQINTDLAVDSAATTMGQKLGGALGGATAGFSVVTGVMGTFGAESEEVEKLLLRVNAAMAMAQGLQGLKEAAPLFIQLKDSAKIALEGIKTGIAATGIGVLLLAVGAIVAYWDDIKEVVSGVSAEQKALNDLSSEQLKIEEEKLTAFNLEENALRLQGKSEDFILKRKIEQTKQVIKKAKAELALSIQTAKMDYEAEVRNQRIVKNFLKMSQLPINILLGAVDSLTYGLEKMGLMDKGTSLVNDLATWEASFFFDPKATKAEGEKVIAEQKAAIAKLESDNAGHQLRKNAMETQANNKSSANRKIATDNKKQDADDYRKLEAEADEKAKNLQLERERKFEEEIEALDEENFQNRLRSSMSKEAYELELVRQKYWALEEAAKDNAEQLAIITTAKENELKAITDKYKVENAALDKATKAQEIADAKAVAEQKAAIQTQGLDTALQGVQLVKGLFEKQKGVQKAAVIAESAIGIAKMVIANKLANIGALATPQAIATSGAAAAPVIAMNNISTGIGIAANLAATGKALKSLGGGSVPPAPNSSGGEGGGGGGGGQQQAPQFNVVGNSGINQLAQLQQQPTQAYVVSGAVTSAQSLDRNRIQNATIG